MAAKTHHTFKKNAREKEKQMKKQAKLAKKEEAKRLKEESGDFDGDGDPDLAGIVPGPQPKPEV